MLLYIEGGGKSLVNEKEGGGGGGEAGSQSTAVSRRINTKTATINIRVVLAILVL